MQRFKLAGWGLLFAAGVLMAASQTMAQSADTTGTRSKSNVRNNLQSAQTSTQGSTPDAQEGKIRSHSNSTNNRDLVGTKPLGEQDSTVRRSRNSKALEEAVRRVAEAWGNEFAEAVRPLESLPGRRLGAVESAMKRLAALCSEWAGEADARAQKVAARAGRAGLDVPAALAAATGGEGFGERLLALALEAHDQGIDAEGELRRATTRLEKVLRRLEG